jgi:superfamily II DNA or RNA helicase
LIEPRPYQIECVNTVLKKFKEGVTRQLISLPTGAGKTICFGMMTQALDTRTLVLAHRDELLTQAAEKISLVDSGVDIGIFKAENRDGLDRDICVAGVQTATRHTDQLKQRNFKFCVCDEAHHAPSPSYMRIFNELGFMAGDLGKLLVGVTATAYRMDGKPLGDAFEEIVYEKNITEMIRGGYLCDVRGLAIGTDTDIRGVHTRSGDFAADELEAAVDIPERNALIAETYLKYCQGKKAVAFGVSVQHAQHIAEAFWDRGVLCEAMWGSMDNDAREEILAKFKAGEIRVLSNCMILTEGFDDPAVEVILMSRPTKSRGLYIQIVGRGLRLSPGKKECLVLDFVDIAREHELCGIGALNEGKIKPKAGQSFIEAMEEAERHETTAPLRRTTEVLDLFQRSRFAWTTSGQNYRLPIGDTQSLVCTPFGEGYRALLVERNGATTLLSKDILSIDDARGICEEYARRAVPSSWIDRNAKWRGYPATERQIDLLEEMGVLFDPRTLKKGQAADLISQMMNKSATAKQLFFIEQKKLHENPEILTKKEAHILIQQYKAKAETVI